MEKRSTAILGAYTGEVIILRLNEDNTSLRHVCDIKLHNNAVKGISTDNNTIFSVSADGEAAHHDITNFKLKNKNEEAHLKIANGCSCLREGCFVSVSRDLKLCIWHQDGVEILNTPHTNSIKCVACNDGRYIASGGYFGMVCIYDTVTKKWLKSMRPSTTGISCIANIPDSQSFICSSYYGKLHKISL